MFFSIQWVWKEVHDENQNVQRRTFSHYFILLAAAATNFDFNQELFLAHHMFRLVLFVRVTLWQCLYFFFLCFYLSSTFVLFVFVFWVVPSVCWGKCLWQTTLQVSIVGQHCEDNNITIIILINSPMIKVLPLSFLSTAQGNRWNRVKAFKISLSLVQLEHEY